MKKQKEILRNNLNVWNKYDFHWCGICAKVRLWGYLTHIIKCLKLSWQRIVRGYSEEDVWNMDSYLQRLFPEMLQYLKDNRTGSPVNLGEFYYDEDGNGHNDTCHTEWDKILDQMIFLWREANEDTCSLKNPYEDEYYEAFLEWDDKYGDLVRERAEDGREYWTCRLMSEIPEYKDIYERHKSEDLKLEKYREECNDKAFDMMKEYFYMLWY